MNTFAARARNVVLLQSPSRSACNSKSFRYNSPAVNTLGFAASFSKLETSDQARAISSRGILDWARQASMGCELAPKEAPEGLELGTFAGGCFWGLELAFQRVPGVVSTSVGYTQGELPNPTYESVCGGRTGHTEAVQVTYDPQQVDFTQLLEAFASQTDVTQLNRQGSDRGTQYRCGVYYHNEEQRMATEAYYAVLNNEIREGKRSWAGNTVVAECKPAGDYYIAEKYHQQYLAKGGRFGMPQSAEKGNTDKIRCYG